MASTVKIYDVEKPKLSLSYWQLATLGIVPLVGLGVWYYYRSRKTNKESSSSSQQNGFIEKTEVKETTLKPKKTVQITKQNSEQTEVSKTPLQRAKSIKDAGNVFFKEGKYADAIRCYSEAIDLCPQSEVNTLSTFYQNRAACYDQLNNSEETVKDCSKALELNPRYIKALSRREKAFQTMGKLTESLEDITAVCILENFQNQKSLEMAEAVLKDLGRTHSKEAMENKQPIEPSHYFVKAYFTSFPNDPVVNASEFQAVEVNPNSEKPLSHLERAKQHLLRGHYAEVVPACTEAVEHGEGLDAEALLLRATMYLLRGQHTLAFQDLDTIINSRVENVKVTVNALIKRGSLHLQADDRDKTLEDFETAERLDPNNPDLYLHRGQVHLLTDNLEQSISDFKKCVSLNPNFGIAVMQGHYAQYRQAVQENSVNGITKVIEKFKRDIRKFPKCAEAYTLLAQILMDQQQYDDADKYFETALQIDPSNATLMVHRGLLQLQWKGDLDKAMSLINDGIKVDDRCSFCYETLGTIEVQRGNLKRAVELFDKAIPLSKTEMELSHIFSLRDAAIAQQVVAERLGLSTLIGQ